MLDTIIKWLSTPYYGITGQWAPDFSLLDVVCFFYIGKIKDRLKEII